MNAWRHVTLGVASMEEALRYWADSFGFEVAGRADGPDEGLESYWGLAPGGIARQALIRAPGAHRGMLHLVEYAQAAESVRQGAAVFDLCPKNLDIYVDDMPARMAQLRRAGFEFRTDTYSEVTAPNGVRFREVHLAGHDDINLVLLQLLDEALEFGPAGYTGIGPLIMIVADAEQEKSFYRDVMGLDILHDNLLSGPEIERMIGLPAGAALDVSIWGVPGAHLGQVEIITYQGTTGLDRYPRARPGARGIIRAAWMLDDTGALRDRLLRHRISFQSHQLESSLLGAAESLVFRSPAGFTIEVLQQA